MNRLLKWTSLLAISATMPAALAANLVVNGSFETGDFSGWTVTPAQNNSYFGVIEFPQTPFGQHVAFFAGGEYDEFSQNLATMPGQRYVLSFHVRNTYSENDGVRIGWDGGTLWEQTPVPYAGDEWHQVTLYALATSAGSELSVRGVDVSHIYWVDNFSVEAVPEPTTLAILGLGLTAAIRRRMQQRT